MSGVTLSLMPRARATASRRHYLLRAFAIPYLQHIVKITLSVFLCAFLHFKSSAQETIGTVQFEVSAFANLYQNTHLTTRTAFSIDPIVAPICDIGPNQDLIIEANGCVVDRGINCSDASGTSATCRLMLGSHNGVLVLTAWINHLP